WRVGLDYDGRVRCGIPGNANRGLRAADDRPGPPIDPSSGSRDVTATGVAAARAFLERRFPALAGAPLLGSEVCQYESTPDTHFIVDRHPAAANVDRGRRIRPRVQDGPGRRRDARRVRPRRRGAGSAVRDRAIQRAAAGRVGTEMVLASRSRSAAGTRASYQM